MPLFSPENFSFYCLIDFILLRPRHRPHTPGNRSLLIVGYKATNIGEIIAIHIQTRTTKYQLSTLQISDRQIFGNMHLYWMSLGYGLSSLSVLFHFLLHSPPPVWCSFLRPFPPHKRSDIAAASPKTTCNVGSGASLGSQKHNKPRHYLCGPDSGGVGKSARQWVRPGDVLTIEGTHTRTP